MATEDQIDKAWENAKLLWGEDSGKYRQDPYGNKIHKGSFGKDSPMGWEINLISSATRGGSDATQNLEATHRIHSIAGFASSEGAGVRAGVSPEWHFLKGFFRAEIVSNSGRNVALIT